MPKIKELKKDTLDSIVTALAIYGESELLQARAQLATGAALTAPQKRLLRKEGYDLNHSACYEEAEYIRNLQETQEEEDILRIRRNQSLG